MYVIGIKNNKVALRNYLPQHNCYMACTSFPKSPNPPAPPTQEHNNKRIDMKVL